MMVKRSRILALAFPAALLLITACSLFLPARGPLKFDPPELPGTQVGAPYEARVTVSDNATPPGSFAISEGALPPGLQVEQIEHTNTARIFGTPQQAGTFHFKIYVWCYGTNVSGQTGEKEYSIAVK